MQDIAFLCSGGGGNLRFVVEAIALGVLQNASVCVVLTDRECLANQFARERGIATEVLDFANTEHEAIVSALKASGAKLVVTNVHRILKSAVIETYRDRLVNLHYSLLPAYGGVIGTRPVEMALADGAKFIGTTAHEVELAVDAGRPIGQAVIPVQRNETVHSVMDTVFQSGCLTLLQALHTKIQLQHEVSGVTYARVQDRDVLFNPALSFPVEQFGDDFWRRLANYPG